MTDVILNKLQTVRRCLLRIDEEYAGDFANLENVTKQDAVESSADIPEYAIQIPPAVRN